METAENDVVPSLLNAIMKEPKWCNKYFIACQFFCSTNFYLGLIHPHLYHLHIGLCKHKSCYLLKLLNCNDRIRDMKKVCKIILQITPMSYKTSNHHLVQYQDSNRYLLFDYTWFELFLNDMLLNENLFSNTNDLVIEKWSGRKM